MRPVLTTEKPAKMSSQKLKAFIFCGVQIDGKQKTWTKAHISY